MMSANFLRLSLMPFIVSTTWPTTPWSPSTATGEALRASWLAGRVSSAFWRPVVPSCSIEPAASSSALACCSVRPRPPSATARATATASASDRMIERVMHHAISTATSSANAPPAQDTELVGLLRVGGARIGQAGQPGPALVRRHLQLRAVEERGGLCVRRRQLPGFLHRVGRAARQNDMAAGDRNLVDVALGLVQFDDDRVIIPQRGVERLGNDADLVQRHAIRLLCAARPGAGELPCGARDGTRTRTPPCGKWRVLSPLRLPISPPGPARAIIDRCHVRERHGEPGDSLRDDRRELCRAIAPWRAGA